MAQIKKDATVSREDSSGTTAITDDFRTLPGIIPSQQQDQGISQTLQQPGAVPVPGISMEGTERNSRRRSPREEDMPQILPIAMRIPDAVIDDASNVIDGFVINTTRYRRKPEKLGAFMVVLCSVITLTLIINPSRNSVERKFWRIFKTVSSEAALKDKKSPQHYVWNAYSNNLPSMKNFYEFIEDRDRVIQRYLSLLIPLCTMSAKEWNNPKPYEHACNVMMCNDDQQVEVMVLRNNANNMNLRGGGIICPEIGYLLHLTDFIFSRNALKGTIPTEIGLLKELSNLDLRENFLTGTIPTEIGLLHQLEWIYLDNNLLTGTIPTEIGNLKNLKFSNFSSNSLSGSLPSELSNLTNLGGLALQQTNITGSLKPFCFLNFTNEPFVLEKDVSIINLDYSYKYSGFFGLYTECRDSAPILECDCCICG